MNNHDFPRKRHPMSGKQKRRNAKKRMVRIDFTSLCAIFFLLIFALGFLAMLLR